MCGIFGYFNLKRESLEHDFILKMGQKLQHRGPDDEGKFISDGILLGNRRLSIIDIEEENNLLFK